MKQHMHCRNYAPLDVVKGICHRSKDIVPADETACEYFDLLPRCSHCSCYSEVKDSTLGVCGADDNKPMTYPELVATTCTSFEWRL